MCGGSNSVVDDIVSGATQIATGGLVDYNPGENKIKGGVVTDTVVKGLKDISGASAAEEANKQARKQFEAEKQARLNQEKEAQARTARDQMAASRRAASVRKSGKGKSSASKGAGLGNSQAVSNLGSDEKDFLGL